MHCFSFRNCNKTMPFEQELTETEKHHTMKMCGLIDVNTPLNETFFNNMNKKQVNYLLSKVDMQDAQHSYSYATYIKKLHMLADKLNS